MAYRVSYAETYANSNSITFVDSSLSNDASLSDLTIDSSTVTGFSSTTYSYDIIVGNATESVTIGATATDTDATITGDTGTQSLSVGENILTVTCTAEDGTTTQDYVINVTREALVPDGIVFNSAYGTITDYTGTATDLVIPSTIDGVDVVNIGTEAFKENSSLENIELPDSLETIYEGAFALCSNLVTISIGENVSTIEDFAFASCENLQSITVDAANQNFIDIDGVLITADGVLIQYPIGHSRISYTVPVGVISIYELSFYGCHLENVYFNDNITSVGLKAFEECTALQSIDLGNKLEIVDNFAFRNCTNLSSVAFGDSLITIGLSAFQVVAI